MRNSEIKMATSQQHISRIYTMELKFSLTDLLPVVRPSQLWGEFCLTDSVNCAAALINGETGQTVDLNVPSLADFFRSIMQP